MAAGELPRPGTTILQKQKTVSASFIRPTLVPCAVGPAFEVIKILTSDGTLNPKALFGAYKQLGLGITESAFPDPRGNLDELDILEDTVKPYMVASGTISELPISRGYGSAFLAASHGASKAAIRTAQFGLTGLDLNGKTLIIALDQPILADTSKDIVITFVGAGKLTPQDTASQINDAVGQDVARVVGEGGTAVVEIASPRYGALSSVTVRAGASANSILQIGYVSASAAHSERVEGAGWRAQDDNNNDTVSPWIEFYIGDYKVDGVSTAFDLKAGLYNIEDPTAFVSAKGSAVTFGDAGIPLKVGDYVYCDGTRLKAGEVARVEASRFKVGTINTSLSTADENGNYTSKVFDIQQVETMADGNPFAPNYVYFIANSLDSSKLAPTAATLLCANSGAAATPASVTGGTPPAGPYAIAGLRLHYVVTVDGVETEGTFTFTGGPFADMASVVTALGSNIPGVTPTATGETSDKLTLTTSKAGRLQAIAVKADGTVNSALGFSTSADMVSTDAKDVEFASLTGKTLNFTLDKNPHAYTVIFSSDSLDLAVEDINTAVGATVASKGGGGVKLLLTSTLKGLASDVQVSGTGNAAAVFGTTTGTAAAGAKRPMPSAYLDDTSVLHITPQLLRDPVTGYPLDPDFNAGSLYVQYKALRRDVTAVAQVAGVLRMSDPVVLSATLDPLTEENPLGLAMFLMMANAPTFEVKGLGVDEVSAAAPEGTGAAYARAAALLEAEEVYALAPLTQDEVILSLWKTHVGVMSEPEQGGERILFMSRKMPTRKSSSIALSGTQASSTATPNQLLLDGNPASGLVTAGINPAATIPEGSHVYVEVTVAGEFRRYNVKSVSGALVNLRTTFESTGTNVDGFYSTAELVEAVVGASYSLKVRGASLVVPGSNPERLDYGLVSEAVSDGNAAIKSRRVYSLFPDTIKTTISGVEKSLPSYYACACYAGMVGAQPPQQPFTNFPVTGLTGVSGTEKFTKRQLNLMAGGGTFILIQDTSSSPVVCRHQLSTDTTSIETRELSITKVVDFTAKFLRMAVRRFIGTNVINTGLIDSLSTTVHAVLQFLEEAGVLNGYNLNNIIQDPDNKDTVLIDVTLDVPYPCNYIRLSLVI